MYKIIFLNSMVLGTLISVSSYSWMSMWMGLEINLLSIIPLFSNSKNIFASESSLKYFITQALASLILLMSITMLLLTDEFIHPLMNLNLKMMLNSALLTKLGAAPFHFWFPEVMEGLSWMNALILLTWQKIAPILLLMNNKINTNFLMMIIILSLTISAISSMNQISMRKILALSSINHIGWMLSSLMTSISLWLIYFLIYSLINLNIILIFNKTKTFYLNQLNNITSMNKLTKFIVMLNFLSLGGLPPFIGFMPKWFVINTLSSEKTLLLTLTMIMSTLIMLFIYTRIMISSSTLTTNEPKIKTSVKTPLIINLINSITLISLPLCSLMFNFL
uniref:NADH-ubiquinone oxidoreductase chain 2 n=1 Tax=Tribolium confusum TaxID=7071 RepID=A0A0U1Z8R2_TRICF|nr:NADH dehydrogenase subunit 2 [Tribolium confusum]AJP09522.1 NADH dehydrogenase subunit 2 [Tribolium confusum]